MQKKDRQVVLREGAGLFEVAFLHDGSGGLLKDPEQEYIRKYYEEPRVATHWKEGIWTLWHNAIKLQDAKTGKACAFFRGHTADIRTVAFSPDGRKLASGGLDKTVRLWDAETGFNTFSLAGHKGQVYALAFSPDGRTLASAGGDYRNAFFGEILLWDLKPEKRPPSRETSQGDR